MSAVEWQEDLDVVLTVALGKEGGGCQAQAGHQGTPPSPHHQCVRGAWGKLLLSGAPHIPGQMKTQQRPGAEYAEDQGACALEGDLGLG